MEEDLKSTGLLSNKQIEFLSRIKNHFYFNHFGQNLDGKVLRGYNIITTFSEEAVEYAYEKWTPKESDVFIVTYPKTGTHWVHEIVRQILYQNETAYKLAKVLPTFLEMPCEAPDELFDFLDEIPLTKRIFSTHLPAALTNLEKLKQANAKVIYVLRNPKDEMVSWYHFAQKLPKGLMKDQQHMHNSGWNNYFDHIIASDYPMHSKPGEWYPEHILEWYKHKDYKNMYYLHYENLKKDLQNEVLNLAKFLETTVSSERAEDIAHKCTFTNMRKALSEDQAFTKNVNMRKGEVGGWKDYFTVAQSEKVDQIMSKKLADTEIRFIYEL